jgi:hypothetical protein
LREISFSSSTSSHWKLRWYPGRNTIPVTIRGERTVSSWIATIKSNYVDQDILIWFFSFLVFRILDNIFKYKYFFKIRIERLKRLDFGLFSFQTKSGVHHLSVLVTG